MLHSLSVAGCEPGHGAVDSLDASIHVASHALTSDADGDGVADDADNCPYLPNASQANANGIGPGDACELSLIFTTGLLGQYVVFQSHKELVIGLAPLTLSTGPDLMKLSAPAPSGAAVNISLLTQKLGVRSGLELLPGATDTVSGSEALRIAVGSASELGGGKASDIWLRLDGTATIQVKLLSGTTAISTQSVTNQGTTWKHWSGGGALFDSVELRVTSGKFSLQGGGEAVMFALGEAALPCPSGYQRVGTSCVDIDECAGINRVCDALTTCTNTVGSFVCGACPTGYTGTGLSGCSDVNECTAGTATCSSLVSCSNTMGSYQCGACPSGYTGDGHTCTDIDECTQQTDGCDPLVTCTNTPGSYTCGSCPSGYTGGGATSCVDVDECTGPNRVCDPLVTCVNSQGGYTCGACPSGYRGTGASSCVDIDECSEGSATCSPLVTCGNTPGSYQCGACPSGFAGDGQTCTDIDECANHTAQCDALATCVNTTGGYSCGACPSGYTGDGHTCTDIDECTNHPCDARTSCTNTSGSYTCGACPAGFSGDGYAGCVDIDECNAGTDTCSPLVTCGNTLGSYTCSACPSGYSGDGHTCADIDECAAQPVPCDSHVTCTNSAGGYSCGSCPAGFVGDGHTCTDIDECVNHPCDSLTSCTNTVGSYLCSACPTGYQGDGYAGCADIDECAVNNGGCAQTDACVNTPGSHNCATCAASTVGVTTSCGVGACAATGVTSCVYGQLHDSCTVGAPAASDVSCDGVDDNCNGQIDEGYVSTPTSCGTGACASSGTLHCTGGSAVNSCLPGTPTAADTSCDGIDEDCDGQVDEDFPSAATSCGVGACLRNGALSCASGQTHDSCLAGSAASSDVTCDGIDDNCDGLIDEGFTSTANSCGAGACTRFGTSVCINGVLGSTCSAGAPAARDDCNGIDDDCDGQVDEDFVPVATSCGTGACAAQGMQGCVNGAVVDSCAPSVGTACDDGDVCNGQDVCSAAGVCQPSSPGSTLCCDGAVLPDPLALTPIDPTVVTSFLAQVAPLYDGPYASQVVGAGVIDPAHVSVVRGRVLDEAGNPLACVAVRAASAAQYGVTRTRADGTFSFAVNGGGPLTIRADLTGFITSRRTVQTVWHHFVTAQDIRLLAYPASQPVSASATTTTVVAGALETDKDGARRATLLFSPGTHATVAGETSPRANYGVRIKEFTNLATLSRDGMPAPLPASSAFTYATSLSVEGAEDKDVTFDKPIAMYVENFLGFPNGEAVPTGRYDRTAEQWVAENSGRVVRIASISADGHAALDIDATAGADDTSTLGVTESELLALGARYTVGQSLWRVALQHFSDWDSNWGWGPPPDAEPPHCEAPFNDDSPDWGPNTCAVGSLIDCDTANLREHIPITATPFELFYASGRQPGSAKRVLHVPVTGTTPLPASAIKVSLKIEVAGVTPPFTMDFDKSLGRTFTYTWDGKNSAGRMLQGPVPATVTVSNWYPGAYQSTSRFGYKGNGNLVSGSSDRQQFALSKVSYVDINGGPADYAGLGGWTLNDHHSYDSETQVMFRGDGTRQGIGAAYTQVQNVVGGGPGAPTDGSQATQVNLSFAQPMLTFGKDGSMYFTTSANGAQFVRKVDPQGVISTIAGGGNRYYDYDRPSPGNQAAFELYGMAMGPDDNLYVTQNDSCVLKVDLTTKVVSTHVCIPGLGHAHLAFGQDGSLYALISSFSQSQLLKIHGDRTWEVFATGGYWFDLAVHPDGGVIIADLNNRRIVRVSTDGSVKTIAGGGATYVTLFPDGTPVETAMLSPFAVAVGPDGLVYFADQTTNPTIYRVTSTGTLERVVGTGVSAVAPDGTPATRAPISTPYAISFAPNRALYYQELQSGLIQRVAVPPRLGDANQPLVASESGRELYAFDAKGRHLWTSDAYSGAKTRTFGYDPKGRLLSITDERARVTMIERAPDGTALAIVAPDGQRTSLQIDATKMLVGLTKPNNDAYVFGYTSDGGGLLTSMKDPKAVAEGGPGYVFEYQDGKLKRDIAPTGAGQTLSASFRDVGSQVSRSTALGRTTQYATTIALDTRTKTTIQPDNTMSVWKKRLDNATAFAGPDGQAYDQLTTKPDGSSIYVQTRPNSVFGIGASFAGRTLEVMPSGVRRLSTQTESTSVSAAPAVTQQTWSTALNGRATVTTYDGATRTFTTTTPAGRTSKRSLDTTGNVSRIEQGGALPIDFAYDTSGRVQSVAQGVRVQTNAYFGSGESKGYLESATDALGETTAYVRDALGRVQSATAPDQGVTSYNWDGLGSMTSVTPPARPVHMQGFDSLGEQLSYTPPALSSVPSPSTLFGYNLDRQLTSITRPDGVSVGLTYEPSGNLDIVTTPTGSYNHDYYGASTCAGCTPGKLSKITSPGGVVQQFTYDGSLLKTATWSGPVSGTVAFSYDTDFRVATEAVNGSAVSFGYDADGLVTCASPTTCSPAGSDALRITWDPLAPRVTNITLGNTSETRTYNAYGELSSLQVTANGTLLYSETIDAPGSERDALGRVVTRTESTPSGIDVWKYTYDANGRLTVTTHNDELYERLTYDGNGNRIRRETLTEDIAATYDAQERLLTYGSFAYTYTANGELLTKTNGDTGDVTTYTYDARGNLIRVVLPSADVIEYVVDGHGRRIAKKKNSVLQKRWVYRDALQIVAELDGSGGVASRFVYGSRSSVPDYVVRQGTVYRFVGDHLGSPRVLVNAANGAVLQQTKDDSWGAVLGSRTTPETPFGFAGGLYDEDTGLIRFGARDYDPVIGRWTAKDPTLFRGRQANLYVYVGNDPINRTDPTGLWTLGFGQSVAFGFGVGFGVSWQGVIDGHGGSDFQVSVGVGAGLGASANIGGVQYTGAETVADLRGWGSEGSVPIPPFFSVGGVLGAGFEGVELGWGLGADVHAFGTYTWGLTDEHFICESY